MNGAIKINSPCLGYVVICKMLCKPVPLDISLTCKVWPRHYFPDQLVFNELCDALITGWNIEIDSWALLVMESGRFMRRSIFNHKKAPLHATENSSPHACIIKKIISWGEKSIHAVAFLSLVPDTHKYNISWESEMSPFAFPGDLPSVYRCLFHNSGVLGIYLFVLQEHFKRLYGHWNLFLVRTRALTRLFAAYNSGNPH